MRWKPTQSVSFACTAALCTALAGCVNGPFPNMSQALRLPPGPPPVAAQTRELQTRAAGLDSENQSLHARLAQQEQRTAQLQDALQRAEQEKSDLRRSLDQAAAAGPTAAKSRQRGPAAAPVTYDGDGPLPLAHVAGAEVLRDGDVVRIRLTTAKLFSAGRAELKPDVKPTLDAVAATLRSQYAGHLVGIEGHTDPDPISKSKWKSNHELAVARSVAVFQALKQRGISEGQLFVAGYGPNRPIADNHDAHGKEQNRRVEIVIYPQRDRGN